MKVLVTGATGQLGFDVCRELARRGAEHWGVSSREMDLRDDASVRRAVLDYGSDAVIHCAAWTRVDAAEDDPAECWAVNADGTARLAAACREAGAKLLYISTDYVFPGDGERFYEPDDPTRPAGVYGKSKLAGEEAVRSALERYFIVRISWVFGKNGGNFVKTMLRLSESRDLLRVVDDQIGSPTYTRDLAPLLCDMIETEKYGVYHATNEGVCSWAELAREIFALTGRTVTVQGVTTEEYGARAPRPKNSRMSKDCLARAGFARLPDWHDALERYLKEIEAI